VQVVSSLLKYGPSHIGSLITGLRHWLEDHEYESVDQMRGSMSLRTARIPPSSSAPTTCASCNSGKSDPTE
jgi:dihydroorotate dehydrogenase (fumarate)